MRGTMKLKGKKDRGGEFKQVHQDWFWVSIGVM